MIIALVLMALAFLGALTLAYFRGRDAVMYKRAAANWQTQYLRELRLRQSRWTP